MNKMLFSLLIVFAGLISGYTFQILADKKVIKLPVSMKKIRRSLQIITLSAVIPLTVIISVWIAPLKHVEIFSLPLFGIFAVLLGGAVSYIISGFLHMDRDQRGVYTIVGGFANMGSLGGLIAFILLGEVGFALVAFYQMFEKFVYFLIGFPFAKNHSIHHTEDKSLKSFFLEVVKDPVITINLAALLIGTVLNLSGIERPFYFTKVNHIMVPAGSFLLIFSIGLAMKFGKMKDYIHASLILIFIKSVFVPAVVFMIAYLSGLGNIENGLVLRFLLILSSMPVSFIAMVPPTIYDMDQDLANTCWFFTTMSLVITIPVISMLLPLIR